jgi:hypothetical protein
MNKKNQILKNNLLNLKKRKKVKEKEKKIKKRLLKNKNKLFIFLKLIFNKIIFYFKLINLI